MCVSLRGALYAGRGISRPVADVSDGGPVLVAAGAREITLLGQNVNAYHGVSPTGGEWRLAALIEELTGIPELARLRYACHPIRADMSPDLIEAHGKVDVLMPYLHLPVQPGSDSVLSAMNRQHSAADYLAIPLTDSRCPPDIALSSDFIVGHPGETDEDFMLRCRWSNRSVTLRPIHLSTAHVPARRPLRWRTLCRRQ